MPFAHEAACILLASGRMGGGPGEVSERYSMVARRGSKRSRIWLEELEPRWLLSADIVPFAAPEAPFPESAIHEAVVDVLQAESAAATAPIVAGRLELVFVDTRVADYERLVADIEAQNDGWRRVEVVVLDPERDGIAQVTEALAARLQLDAVHFISHGADGAVQLGGSWLDARSLTTHETAIDGWGRALKADGDLLFYGCDIAASATGEAFLGQLASLTHADVAASSDFTGADALGGDWRLEFTLGVLESDVVVSSHAQAAWNGLLSTQTLDWDAVPATPLAETGLDTRVYTTSYSVGGGTVTVTVSDPADRLRANGSPALSNVVTGGLAAPSNSLRMQSDGFQPGEAATVTITFTGFAGGVSNVGLLMFDLDTSDDGVNFVDRVVFSADNGAAIDPSAITVGPAASVAAGLGAAAVENAWSYNSVIGTNTVEGRWTGNNPIPLADDPNQEDNSPDDRSNGNAYAVFGQSGITTVSFTYSNAPGRTASSQGIALHDITFDPTPTAGDDAYTIAEDGTLVVPALTGVLGNDADPNADPLSALLVAGPANGALALNADGSFTYAPNANFNGTDTFTYRASDGVGVSTIATVTLTVTAVNDAPTLALSGNVTVNEDAGAQSVAGFATATPGGGPDEAAQTFTFVVGNDNPALFAMLPSISPTGTLTFTPAANASGTATVTVSVRDSGGTGNGGQDTSGPLAFTLTVNPVNDAPVLAAANNLAGINEDDTASTGTLVSALIAGQVTDVDPGALSGIAVTGANSANGTWQFTTDGGGIWIDFGAPSAGAARLLAADADTRVRFVPGADWNGAATIDFRAWDRTSGAPGGTANTVPNGNATAFSATSATASVTVAAVSDTVDDGIATNEDNAVVVNVLANDSFEDATRTLTGVTAPANGGVVFDASGSVTYTPNANWNGAEVLTYTVTAGGVTETGTLTITVNAVNDEPSFTLAGNQTVNEDAAAQTVVGFATGARGGGPDEAGQTLTYTVTNDNNSLFLVQPAIASDGTLTYTPTANGYGTATVNVFVTDDGGTANGGDDTSPIQNFTITVTPVADTPSVTNAATLEDTQTTSGLVISPNPADGAEVTHYKITAISGGTLFLNDGTTVVASGSFVTEAQGAAGLRFTPSPDSVIAGSFDVQASLAGNDAGLGGNAVTATIAVTPVNDVPSFVLAGNQTVNEDAGAQLVALFAVGSPGGGPDEAGQTLAYTATNDNNALFAAQPGIAADGSLSYTPAADASGTATVSVFLSDNGGTLNGGIDASAVQTFTITVTPVADLPMLGVNPAAGNEDTAIPLSVSAVLVDTDGSETLAVTVSAIPVGAILSDGTSSFTANAGSQSVDVSGWNLAALTVMPPVHSDTDFTLSVSATATEGASGAFATSVANLAVTVDAVADAPSVVIAPAAGNEDTPIALALTPSLVDTDGSETLAVTIAGIPVGATLTDGLNTFTATAGNQSVVVSGWSYGALSITPPVNSDTDFTLGIAATASELANGSTATTNVVLTVDVVPINDAPVLLANSGLTVDEGAAATLAPAMLSVTDVDNTPAQLVYAVTTAPANGRLERVAAPGVAIAAFTQDDLDNGRIRYVHDGSETLADVFTFSVSDGAGGAIGATAFAITVNPVNDAPALTVNRLTLTDGQTVTLTLADLDAIDPDNPPADLTFAASGIQHGRFELASAPGVAIAGFTYGQLAAGEVRFVHAGGNQAPSYTVTPSDLVLAGPTVAAQITFTPASGSSDGGVLVKPINTAGDDPLTVLAPPEPSISGGSSLEAPRADAPIPIPRGLETFDVLAPPSEPEFMPVRSAARAAQVGGFAKTDPFVQTESMDLLRLPGPVVGIEFGKLDFDGPRSRSNIEVLLDMAKMGGVALTVGAVWWATRAAGLLASALSSLPAWRNFDPLPVLGRDEFEDDDWVREYDRHATAEAEEEERLVGRRFSNMETQPIDLEEVRKVLAHE